MLVPLFAQIQYGSGACIWRSIFTLYSLLSHTMHQVFNLNQSNLFDEEFVWKQSSQFSTWFFSFVLSVIVWLFVQQIPDLLQGHVSRVGKVQHGENQREYAAHSEEKERNRRVQNVYYVVKEFSQEEGHEPSKPCRYSGSEAFHFGRENFSHDCPGQRAESCKITNILN